MGKVYGDPPDGGWGWMIMVSFFVVTFLMRGLHFGLSVLFVEFLDYFHESHAMTSWIVSIYSATSYAASPFAAIACDKFGFRKTAIVGGILSCLSLLASSFATGVVYLYISLGLLTGCSQALVFLPVAASLARYFDKRYAIANSIANTAVGIGGFAFPPMCELLVNVYGWRGALMILGAIIANMCVCAVLLRPVYLKSDHHQIEMEDFKCKSQSDEPGADQIRASNIVEVEDEINTDLSTKEHDVTQSKSSSEEKGIFNKYPTMFKEKPFFLCLIVYFFMYGTGLSIPYSHLVDRTVKAGVSDSNAALVMSIMGAVSFASCIATGFVVDCFRFNDGRLYTHCLGVVIFGIATAITPFADTFELLIGIAIVLGIGRGVFSALDTVIVKHVVGEKWIIQSFCLLPVIGGLGFLLGPPFSGYLYDKTGSYDASFYFAGAVLIGCACFLSIARLCCTSVPKVE